MEIIQRTPEFKGSSNALQQVSKLTRRGIVRPVVAGLKMARRVGVGEGLFPGKRYLPLFVIDVTMEVIKCARQIKDAVTRGRRDRELHGIGVAQQEAAASRGLICGPRTGVDCKYVMFRVGA